jgi:glycerophosphoryl diester phosphodiesterase
MNLFRSISAPLVIAHRGASTYAPENTLAAFRTAVEQGAEAIELDAKLSADGEVMVIHDRSVDRTTNGNGLVNSLTLAQLKELDAGSFFAEQFHSEHIPTLDEVFAEVGQKILVNVELTNYASPLDGLVDKVCQLVRRHGLEERVLFSSFSANNLKLASQILPEVPVAILAPRGWMGWVSRSFLVLNISPEWVHPYFSDAGPAYVRRQHELGRKVNAWTVDDPDDMATLLLNRVDGLITDDPLAARQILERK